MALLARGFIGPQQKPQERDTIDYLLAGLQIAKGITGIAVDVSGLMEQKELAKQKKELYTSQRKLADQNFEQSGKMFPYQEQLVQANIASKQASTNLANKKAEGSYVDPMKALSIAKTTGDIKKNNLQISKLEREDANQLKNYEQGVYDTGRKELNGYIKQDMENLTKYSMLRDQLNSKNPADKNLFIKNLARMMDKGAMSVYDVESVKGNQSLLAKLERYAKEKTVGQFTERDVNDFNKTIDVLENAAKTRAANRTEDYASNVVLPKLADRKIDRQLNDVMLKINPSLQRILGLKKTNEQIAKKSSGIEKQLTQGVQSVLGQEAQADSNSLSNIENEDAFLDEYRRQNSNQKKPVNKPKPASPSYQQLMQRYGTGRGQTVQQGRY